MLYGEDISVNYTLFIDYVNKLLYDVKGYQFKIPKMKGEVAYCVSKQETDCMCYIRVTDGKRTWKHHHHNHPCTSGFIFEKLSTQTQWNGELAHQLPARKPVTPTEITKANVKAFIQHLNKDDAFR